MAGTIVAGTISDGTSSTSMTDAVNGSAKAWVTFDGTLVNATADLTGVTSSYNISSVVDNGIGDYTINFTNPLADPYYTWCIGRSGNATDINRVHAPYVLSRSNTYIRVAMPIDNSSSYSRDDPYAVSVTIFR